MFGNTLVLPLSTGNVTLVKINQDGYASEYLVKEALRQIRVRIRHSKTKATADRVSYDRHNVEIVETVFATSTVPEFERKDYVVIERLPSDANVVNTDGMADWLISSVNANALSLIAWES